MLSQALSIASAVQVNDSEVGKSGGLRVAIQIMGLPIAPDHFPWL
jgi:hypothetical protein